MALLKPSSACGLSSFGSEMDSAIFAMTLVRPALAMWIASSSMVSGMPGSFMPGVGTPTVLLDADFVYTADTIANSAKSAKDNGSQLKLVTLYGPIVLGILALLGIFGGLLLMRGRTEPSNDPSAWDETLPKSRHRLRADGTGMPDDQSGALTDTIPGSTPTWSGPPARPS